MINRYLKPLIQADFNKGKALILYGPRQVGKTTLVKSFLSEHSAYYSGDLDEVQAQFSRHNLTMLSALVAGKDTVIIDEAQRIENIGLSLKILIDHFPKTNFIVTGSSSLELADTVNEPLTGRCFVHIMYPVAECELADGLNPVELNEGLEHRLIYGSYPEIITTQSLEDKQRLIEHIADNYLFKDVLKIESIKNIALLERILKALALQIGSEVSLNELARVVDADKNTVKKYLDVCEKIFIVFSLPPFSNNKRKAIAKMKKYYFYDLGIRNALLRQFQPLQLRNDTGALWENYFALERVKFNSAQKRYPHYYFWRSYQGQEIDFLEESNGQLYGFECKWAKELSLKHLKDIFTHDLGGKELTVVNKNNYANFIH